MLLLCVSIEILPCSQYSSCFPQLLNFFKMSFYLFSVCSVFAALILMPVNLKVRTFSLPMVHIDRMHLVE